MSKTAPATKRTKSATRKPTTKKVVKKAVKKAVKKTARKTGAAKAPARKAAARTTTRKTTTAKKTAGRKAATTAGPQTTVTRKPATPRLPADVKLAVAAAQDKLAQDLTVLDLRNASAFTDFFIVCTGANVRQVQAISDAVEASLKAAGQPAALVEGYRRGEWILLDYFSFIVHIFLPAQREFYALERLWGGAEPIEVSAP